MVLRSARAPVLRENCPPDPDTPIPMTGAIPGTPGPAAPGGTATMITTGIPAPAGTAGIPEAPTGVLTGDPAYPCNKPAQAGFFISPFPFP